MGSTQPLPKVPPPQSPTDQEKSKSNKTRRATTATTNLDIHQDSKKKTLIYSSMAAVLLAVILVTNNIIDKYQKESVVDPAVTVQLLAQPLVQPLPQTESVLAPVSSTESAVPEQVMSSVSPAQTAAENLTATENTISASTITTSSPNDFEPSLGQPIELIVEAKKDVEFFYAKGNTKTFTRVQLATKQIQVIRSPAGLHLKAEDGSVLRLILNGIDKGQASASSKPVRLTF